MQRRSLKRLFCSRISAVALSGVIGIGLGAAGSGVLAQMAAPSEHKGLYVETLGVIPAESMENQLDLADYKMQLRRITIAPGGQIAKHSHEGRPGLVQVVEGTWIEGRPDGEMAFTAGKEATILEDEDTVHWFRNGGDAPATALVCDIVPAG